MKRKKAKMSMRWYVLLAFFLWTVPSLADGLQFLGNSYRMEDRTAYKVFAEEAVPEFENELVLDFEMQIKEFNTFGYIFRMKDLNSKSVFSFIFTYKNDRESVFQINSDGKASYASVSFVNDSLRCRWLPVSFGFDLQKKTLRLSVGGQEAEVTSVSEFGQAICPDIYFGRDEFTVDLPTFALRNLTVRGGGRQYRFPLSENAGTAVHDASGTVYGEVQNPIWLVNEAYYWKPVFTQKILGPCGANFDSRGKKIYVFSADSLYGYDLQRGSMQSVPCANPLPLKMRLGTNFLPAGDNRLYVYEINGIPPGYTTVASLDLTRAEWCPTDSVSLPVQLHHHNTYWDARHGRLLMFGGFGNQRYSNALLSYRPDARSIDTLRTTGDVISPRFNAGMAHVGDTVLYIYGGVGNSSGDQSLGRIYYNDLYKVSLPSCRVKKCWELPSPVKEVVGNNMIYSEAENALYALRYKEYNRNSSVQLYRIALADGTAVPVGDSIPFLAVAIETSLTLYKSTMPDKLYCVIQEHYNSQPDTVRVSAYELAFPPLTQDELVPHYAARRSAGLWWLLPVVIVLAVGAYLLYRRMAVSRQVAAVAPSAAPAATEAVVSSAAEEEVPVKRGSAVYLFGDFTVYDRAGRDITYMFSNKLKQLFIYILVESAEGTGVLSSSLNTLFWPDKDDAKVKNLKGVTINHLRKTLAEMDGITLNYSKGFFNITLSDECFCDYMHAAEYAGQPERAKDLLPLLARGKFLKGIDDDLFDQIKGRTEDRLLGWLLSWLNRQDELLKRSDVLSVCQLVFEIDPLNEQALQAALNVCKEQKMRGEAQKIYSQFAREYKRMQGKEYPLSMDELLKG